MANNPIFSNKGTFTPTGYGYPAYGQPGQAYAMPGYAMPQPQPQTRPATMTFDDVMNKAAIILALLMLSAGVSYVFLPETLLYPAAVICGLASIVFPFLVAGRHQAGPTICVVYCLVEGVFLGGISKIFEMFYPGIVLQAALGTFVAAAVVMVAFRYAGFRSTPRMSQMLRIGLLAFAGIALLNLVLYFCGINLGLFPGPTGSVSVIAWIAAIVGIGLAVYSLLDDFTYIERGVAMGAPAQQSWIAAYGLAVTMVFLYTQILRLLSYVRR
jgi:uncharacterized YccA/Bax inhibitor family protein